MIEEFPPVGVDLAELSILADEFMAASMRINNLIEKWNDMIDEGEATQNRAKFVENTVSKSYDRLEDVYSRYVGILRNLESDASDYKVGMTR